MTDGQAKIMGQLVTLSGIVEALRAENTQLKERVRFLESALLAKLTPEQSGGD